MLNPFKLVGCMTRALLIVVAMLLISIAIAGICQPTGYTTTYGSTLTSGVERDEPNEYYRDAVSDLTEDNRDVRVMTVRSGIDHPDPRNWFAATGEERRMHVPTATPTPTPTPTPVPPTPTPKPVQPQPAQSNDVAPSYGSLTQSQMLDVLAHSGLPEYAWPTALRIATCESGWNPRAVGSAGERGLWQIHPVHSSLWASAFDPYANGRAMYIIWSNAGGTFASDWTCY